MPYDVAVVGGGPAGARVAWRLARAGAHVALVDGSHPREKPCGGGVTGRALRLVSAQLSGAPVPHGVAVERAVFVQNGARAVVSLPASPPPAHGTAVTSGTALIIFPRADFDGRLYDSAVAAGAAPVHERARDVEATSTGARVRLERGAAIEARWIVGADGANSLVRRRLLAPFSRAELSIATGFFVHGPTSRDIIVEFESRPAGYLWSFPRADHLAVGICAQADRSTAAELRAVASRWIARERFEGTPEPYSWPIPSLSARAIEQQRPAGHGWLLVGDAAGLVDPITREGIFFALQSADLAADAILGGRDVPARFRESLGDEILPELARAAALKDGFFQPRLTGLLIHALRASPKIGAVMADLVAGEQPYRTLARRLLRTFEFGLALELARLRRARR
ncbi:MAG: NAD(P)/FAD-dependent oxidoreductase [Acidobacteria bacterium]|nr:NAD(P)/FAD-dependent oxidoreductase [Acidobacteriota bacterium]